VYINLLCQRSWSGHTYLLAITQLKDWVDHSGSAALHSADRSWIESPSGASAGQFLLVYIAVFMLCFFIDAVRESGWVEEEVVSRWGWRWVRELLDR
jgi:hypothetical protein